MKERKYGGNKAGLLRAPTIIIITIIIITVGSMGWKNGFHQYINMYNAVCTPYKNTETMHSNKNSSISYISKTIKYNAKYKMWTIPYGFCHHRKSTILSHNRKLLIHKLFEFYYYLWQSHGNENFACVQLFKSILYFDSGKTSTEK